MGTQAGEGQNRLIVILGFIYVALAFTSLKLSAPALPVLSGVFHVPAVDVKLSGSVYLIAFALMQLVWGSVARFCDRRLIILLAVGVAFVGTVVSACSVNLSMFITGRVIEALGICVGSPICRVLLADRLAKHEIARYAVIFGFLMATIPIVMPTLGQYLMLGFGWRSIFIFYGACLLGYWLLIWFKLPETRVDYSAKLRLNAIVADYRHIFSTKAFWFYIVPYAVIMSTTISYYMAIPFIYREHFGVSVHYYTLLALFTAVPGVTVYYFAGRLVRRWGTKWCTQSAIVGLLILAIVAWLFEAFWTMQVESLLCLSVLLGISGGFAQPATNAALLATFRREAGTVGAIIPFFPFVLSPWMFLIWTTMPLDSLWGVTLLFSGMIVVCGLVYFIANENDSH